MLINCSLLFNLTPRLNPRIIKHQILFKFSMSSSSMIAEYAKSNRSSCKKCAKTIGKSELRVGLSNKDPRGFDMTKWHHFQCLPSKPASVSNPDDIKGFSSLQSSDQVALRTFVTECAAHVEVQDAEDEPTAKRLPKEIEVQQEDEEGTVAVEQSEIKKRKLLASAGQGELEIAFSASAVTDMYKDASLLPKWKAFQTIIFLERAEGLHDSKKIAAFDFDGCLANTSVRKVGADAWSLMYTSIPEKLQSLYNDGFKVVIFTNEANIEIWKNKRQVAVDSKIGRLENFIKHVKLPIQVFIACGNSRSKPKDPFRKPEPGMWYLMEKHFNSGLPIDMEQSFYVGDAAGRPSDHSDADIKFAEAIGLKFYVPEEFFSQ